MLTRPTCDQRSGLAAACKRQALAFYFPVRICYMFFISKCKGASDLGLCMTLGLVKRMPVRSANFWRILRPNTFNNQIIVRLRGPFLRACPAPACTCLPYASACAVSCIGPTFQLQLCQSRENINPQRRGRTRAEGQAGWRGHAARACRCRPAQPAWRIATAVTCLLLAILEQA